MKQHFINVYLYSRYLMHNYHWQIIAHKVSHDTASPLCVCILLFPLTGKTCLLSENKTCSLKYNCDSYCKTIVNQLSLFHWRKCTFDDIVAFLPKAFVWYNQNESILHLLIVYYESNRFYLLYFTSDNQIFRPWLLWWINWNLKFLFFPSSNNVSETIL